jgi:anti-sigma-K factor RskA
VFGGTVALVAWLLADDKWPPALGLMDNGEAVQLPMEAYCRSSEAHGPLLNAVLAGTLHFSGTHVVASAS